MAERCDHFNLFFLLHICPSSVSTVFQDSSLLPETSRTGSSYQNKGVKNVSCQESCPEGRGDRHSKNSGKLDILLVPLVSTIQLLGAQGETPKVTATSLSVVSTAETLPSSLQNMASEGITQALMTLMLSALPS